MNEPTAAPRPSPRPPPPPWPFSCVGREPCWAIFLAADVVVVVAGASMSLLSGQRFEKPEESRGFYTQVDLATIPYFTNNRTKVIFGRQWMDGGRCGVVVIVPLI